MLATFAEYQILDAYVLQYTGFTSLCKWLNKIYDNFRTDEHGQYVAITQCTSAVLGRIDKDRSAMPPYTMTYDATQEVLVIKFQAGVEHETAGQSMAELFRDHMVNNAIAKNTLVPTGSARFGSVNRRQKEGDVSYKPRTRINKDDFPSFVIEVGVSESLLLLRTDASYWLTQSNGQTKIVLLISVNRRTKEIVMEVWGAQPGVGRTRATINQLTYMPNRLQTLKLTNTAITGTPLHLPADKIFDTIPANATAANFSITHAEMLQWYTEYWQVLQ